MSFLSENPFKNIFKLFVTFLKADPSFKVYDE